MLFVICAMLASEEVFVHLQGSPSLATTAPTVTAVSPIAGPSSGGTAVTITGTNLVSATRVAFGSVAAARMTVVSPTQLTAVAPPGMTTVDVTVANASGPSVIGAADEFTYTFSNNGYAIALSASAANPAPGGSVVLSATANQDVGPTPYGMSIFDATTGDELVHETGGTSMSATVSYGSATTHRYVAEVCNHGGPNAQADSPPVVVTWGALAASAAAARPTVAAPSVSRISPTSGPASGGTAVVITGSNFAGTPTVSFGATAATVTSFTKSKIKVTSPAGSGTVDVRVTTSGGQSATSGADRFTYTTPPPPAAPTVSRISPSSGPASGGQSATSGADRFTYTTPPPPAAPTVSGISPSSGPASGGTAVVITGSNFTGTPTVSFGSTAAAVSSYTSSQIAVTLPAGSGAVDVRVTTSGGQSATSLADRFTYASSSSGSSSGPAMPTGNIPGWTQVFADDFTGSSLNTGAWGAYSGQPGGDPGGWWDPSHVVVGNGMLQLKSYRDPAHANPSNPNGYVSGGVSSAPALHQEYGKYLVRFRMDAGTGIGGVLLLWPSNSGWPPEVDFSEDAGEDPGGARAHTSATLHCGSNGNDACQVQNTLSGIDLTRWHTIGVEWTASSLVFTFDGMNWATVTSGQAAIPATPMEFDAQTQAGDCSTATPCPDASTPSEVDMDIDWAVVYKPA